MGRGTPGGSCVVGRTGIGGRDAMASRRAAGGLMPEYISTWKRRGRVIT